MKVVLVLLFAVCVSSRKTPEKEVESTEQESLNQNYQSQMLISMIQNTKDGLDDLKETLNKMVQETCQETKSIDDMAEDDDDMKYCGATYHASRGSIQHPSSGSYTNNEDCIWIINAAADITIKFTSFNTEIDYDYLRVRDGSSSGSRSLGNFTGSSVPSSVIASSNSAYLRFTSDGSNVDTGFQLTWNSKSALELTVQILSNAILIQGMAIQTLKEDLTNVVKVMTSNLTNAISDQGVALQIMKSNFSDGFSNEEEMLEDIEENQDIIMSNLTRIGDLEIKLKTMEIKIENLTNKLEYVNANLTQKLDYIIDKLHACSHAFEYVSGQCLRFSNHSLTWRASKADCERLSSRLVIPTNFERLGISMKTKGLTSQYWVGASDQSPATPLNYEWLDGSRTPVKSGIWYPGYGPGQASGVHKGQSCVKIHLGSIAQLLAASDTNCDDSSYHNYICEEP